jgi:hypothetical protein
MEVRANPNFFRLSGSDSWFSLGNWLDSRENEIPNVARKFERFGLTAWLTFL